MTRHLVLAGAGAGNMRFLAQLGGQNPTSNLKITLISRSQRYIDPKLQMGFVGGRLALEDCAADIEPLVQKNRIQWLEQQVVALDAQASALFLADGTEIRYDWLSLDPEPVQLRDVLEPQLPGARANGLFLHPTEAFCTLWPRIPQLAKSRALRVAVISNVAASTALAATALSSTGVAATELAAGELAAIELAAIELALATATALPGSAVTLITGGAALGSLASESFRRHLAGVFRAKKITVLQDAATSLAASEVNLASGARLACDVPMLATRHNPPVFLASSALALTAKGFVAIDSNFRSTSHANVLTTCHGGGVESMQKQWGKVLTALVQQDVKSQPPQLSATAAAATVPQHLQFIDCGDGQTLASWRQFSAQGRWLTWLKNRDDRRRLAEFRKI